MAKFFVEDAAHDAVLKILGRAKTEIQISKGRARVISLTLGSQNSIGFIDDDNNVDSRLANVQWQSTDDFKHCMHSGKIFIKFEKNVEQWLNRIAKQCKVDVGKLTNDPEDWHLNQRIVASNHDARQFLQKILDAKNSPLKLLKEVIEATSD
jgi:hypothetical protein